MIVKFPCAMQCLTPVHSRKFTLWRFAPNSILTNFQTVKLFNNAKTTCTVYYLPQVPCGEVVDSNLTRSIDRIPKMIKFPRYPVKLVAIYKLYTQALLFDLKSTDYCKYLKFCE